MEILLLGSAYNGMVQRVHQELDALGHNVSIEPSEDEATMVKRVDQVMPELIICPFLKHRVPDSIWKKHICLIVHPGIEGDRGPSSLDWALTHGEREWGVTLLQANQELDAGDIWGTQLFVMRNASKTSLYRREVIQTAVCLIRQALANYNRPSFRPRPQNNALPHVKGRPHVLMRQASRSIDWDQDSTSTIVTKIRAADGFPGVLDQIGDKAMYLFGAIAEHGVEHQHAPGTILGHRYGAVCRATRDGAVWIKQLKRASNDGQRHMKLPAMQVIHAVFGEKTWVRNLPEIEHQVAYIEFDFYNGAMNTEQCLRLIDALRDVKRRKDVRVITLLGGEDFWSNGIHLNCIEAAADPAEESWRNINAMSDLVKEIILTNGKITIAALRSNAGAGGAIMPLACDFVFARSGVVFNSHYQTMGLHGSEYWTYLLPKRVGSAQADRLTSACLPVLVNEALHINLVDQILPEDWGQYHGMLTRYCKAMARNEQFLRFLDIKARIRAMDERRRPLAAYRDEELRLMKATFDDPDASYHRLRHNFVYKIPCGLTPARLLSTKRSP